MLKKRILVAPLNWGLGHATRSIPIINELLLNNFEVIIASDGEALKLLKKEFPELESHELPSYNITYASKRCQFSSHLLLQTPKILATIKKEKKAIELLIHSKNISGIISDNRWGVRSSKVPSVIITHQLKVLSGKATFFSSKIQQHLLSKFTECWIPDHLEEPNLSGEMGHVSNLNFRVKYIGPFSRLKKENVPTKYKYGIVLSGPEPQRSLLEIKLLKDFEAVAFPVLFIKGVVEAEKKKTISGDLSIHNFLLGADLQTKLNQCEFIICRSGYSSVMDLASLEKKAFLIPTPGQPEQEYLAKLLSEKGMVLTASQEDFNLKLLDNLEKTTGLRTNFTTSRLSAVFTLF